MKTVSLSMLLKSPSQAPTPPALLSPRSPPTHSPGQTNLTETPVYKALQDMQRHRRGAELASKHFR